MSLKRSLIPLLLASIAAAAPTSGQGIQWGPCPKDSPDGMIAAATNISIECGSFSVPLDYTSSDSEQYNMSLIRIPAPKQPVKGTIQFNFGGPGVFAKSTLISQGTIYQTLTGGVYDLVAFDPRGVALELPFTCATSNFTIAQVLSSSSDSSISEREARKVWASSKAYTGICKYQGNANKTAEVIGTAFMARDMARVAEAVDKDGLIRYWGYSYGTTLGATIAAMFPDKVDRMIIDGIQNAKQYYYDFIDSELWTLTDKTVQYLFESCAVAGPEHCALAAATNHTGPEMARDFYNFVEKITKAPVGLRGSGSVFDGFLLKALTFQQLYDVAGWPDYTKALAPILYGTPEESLAALTEFAGGAAAASGAETPKLGLLETNIGIHCGDRIPRTDSFEEMHPYLLKLINTSYYQGGPNAVVQDTCAQWPWKAKEVYKGNFEAKTKHPILVMTNSLDGQTPVLSAKNMSAGFEGAVILENDGVGHTAFSYPTTCAGKHTISYWVDGTLPPEGTVCASDFDPYQKITWPEIFPFLANGTTPGNVKLSARKWLESS